MGYPIISIVDCLNFLVKFKQALNHSSSLFATGGVN